MFKKFAVKSYSQEGEDLVLNRIFEYKKDGFYVDIGAHHPYRFSNTYLFYRRGWRGINVDANPVSVDLLKKHRQRDINLNYLVSSEENRSKKFYMFNDGAINTADENVKQARLKDGYKLQKEITVSAVSLKTILDTHLPKNQSIDFMSIDVEGFDFEVLKSNDWDKYRPHYLIVEVTKANSLNDAKAAPINSFLEERGYRLFAKTVNSFFYKIEH